MLLLLLLLLLLEVNRTAIQVACSQHSADFLNYIAEISQSHGMASDLSVDEIRSSSYVGVSCRSTGRVLEQRSYTIPVVVL